MVSNIWCPTTEVMVGTKGVEVVEEEEKEEEETSPSLESTVAEFDGRFGELGARSMTSRAGMPSSSKSFTGVFIPK